MGDKKKRTDWRISAGIALAVAALLTVLWFAVGRDFVDSLKAGETERKTHMLYYGTSSHAPAFSLLSTAAAEEMPDNKPASQTDAADEAVLKESFLALYEQNPDIAGWLKMGENVDAPVVKRDNHYYMNHNFFAERDRNGTLFVNAQNEMNPRDTVLLIHGHNMKNGDMFGKLSSFRQEEYMRTYPIVSFETAYGEEQPWYVPVAAFDASMLRDNRSYFDITQMVFDCEEDFQAYLDDIQKRSYWASPVDVTVEDKLLMLVTCSYGLDDGRFVLVLRQLREDETQQEVQELFQE